MTAAPADVPPTTPPRSSTRRQRLLDLGADVDVGQAALLSAGNPDAGRRSPAV